MTALPAVQGACAQTYTRSMTSVRLAAAALGVLLVVVYAGGSSLWVQTSSGWYSSLKRPWWQPPDIVFGLIWPYNFIVLGFAMVYIANRLSDREVAFALACFALSVAAALAWSYLFYVPHHLGWSAVALGTAAALTLPVLYFAFKASMVIGLLLIPYQLWVGIATSLAWGYSRLN